MGGSVVESCELRKSNGLPGERCDGSACVFWRAVEHAGIELGEGCAIRHYQLLGDEGVSAWLLSVKERFESERGDRSAAPGSGDAGEEG
jgi:hypothetical protein